MGAPEPAHSIATVLDARVELLSALEAACGRNPCERGEDSEELRAARAAVPAEHEAVRLFREMGPGDWRHRHYALVMLDFTDPPALAVAEHPEHYAHEGKGDAVSRLLPALRDLATAPSVRAWLAEGPSRHAAALARAAEAVAETDYLRPLEEYFGVPLPHRYRFVLAPLLHGTTPHNVLYHRKDGPPLIHSISGHAGVEGGKCGFDHPVRGLRRTAWHEVCHTVVDAWTRERSADLSPLSPLYALMTGRAQSQYQGPPGWLHMVDEHLIRAVVCRLAARVEGEAFGREALEREKVEGFALIGPVHELLREYEKNRAAYPDLRAFYPRLVETFARFLRALPAARRA